MNTDKRRWVIVAIASGLILCPKNIQAKNIAFEFQERPVVTLVDEFPKVPESILWWGFPASATQFGKIGLEKTEIIFSGFSR